MFYNVNILTPSMASLLNEKVEMLFIPTVKGEMNVLPEHTHVVSKLETGVLTLSSAGKDKKFVVESGICKVLHNEIIILTSLCISKENLRADQVEAEVRETELKLSSKDYKNVEAFNLLEKKYRLALAKKKILE